ncbi:hypothetical protein [Nonomuraea sp. NPDC050310]|uniref:hypothetical protein n=1 Tax=Nonomuraea sp. NPDC050310 TaxID=3154935 RepID=UPI0034060048
MRLSGALAEFDISADVNGGHGLAVVPVWADLTVWCDLQWFWWRTGLNSHTHRPVYAYHPVTDVTRAARRVAFSYADLRAANGPHNEERCTGEPV